MTEIDAAFARHVWMWNRTEPMPGEVVFSGAMHAGPIAVVRGTWSIWCAPIRCRRVSDRGAAE